MQTRRLVAAGVVVVVVIAIALLVKSCDSSATTSALKNYNSSVYQLMSGSTSNAQNVLGPEVLASGNLTDIGSALASAEATARSDVIDARRLHAPSQMAAAQAALVTVMQLRQQGLLRIADNVQGAASKDTSRDAVYRISLGTSQLYTSDVIYKTIVTQDIASALNAASVPAQQIYGGQVIGDLGWLDQTWIADKIGAKLSTQQANANNDQPGLSHGDQLNSVAVAGTELAGPPGGTYTLTAADSQTWVLSVTNGGQTVENDIGCSVKVQDVSDAGTATIPTLAAGGTTTCTVRLLQKPPTGPYTVTATVAAVPGEKNLTNNTATYTVTFN